MLNHNNHFHVQGARPTAVFRLNVNSQFCGTSIGPLHSTPEVGLAVSTGGAGGLVEVGGCGGTGGWEVSEIGVKISYAELRLVGEDCWPASGILMNCAGDRDSPRFVSIAKRPCLGRRRLAPTASYEIETRRYADT